LQLFARSTIGSRTLRLRWLSFLAAAGRLLDIQIAVDGCGRVTWQHQQEAVRDYTLPLMVGHRLPSADSRFVLVFL